MCCGTAPSTDQLRKKCRGERGETKRRVGKRVKKNERARGEGKRGKESKGREGKRREQKGIKRKDFKLLLIQVLLT